LKLQDEVRRAERPALEAHADSLTGLYNGRAWDSLLDREEERCRRYGHPASVLLVDLDGLKQINDCTGHLAGDQTIAKAAVALQRAIRGLDVVARLGGDEFAILAAECSLEGSTALEARVRSSLAAAGVAASVGLAMRDPSKGLVEALEHADARMYEEKRLRKAASPHR
jgi:diguanylate cyclase